MGTVHGSGDGVEGPADSPGRRVECVDDALAAGRQADGARVDEPVGDDGGDVHVSRRRIGELSFPDERARVRVECKRCTIGVPEDLAVGNPETVRTAVGIAEPVPPEKPARGEVECVDVAVEVLEKHAAVDDDRR
jgi:hypothetical protein